MAFSFQTIQNTPDPAEPASTHLSPEQRLLEWLLAKNKKTSAVSVLEPSQGLSDDWQTVSNLCGYQTEDFFSAGVDLPLTTSEIDYFRRNHRGVDAFAARDFLLAKIDLPSPLAELYGLYRHRAQVDTEAALFVAQATGSTRVARVMADLLAIGSYANAMEFVSHITMTYSVPAAFDTSDLVDRANQEAQRRLTLPIDHPAHLLTLTPDEIGVLAGNIVDRHILCAADFMEKANLLAEARQDVNRMPKAKQFVTSVGERDLPIAKPWVARICTAYARIFESWVVGMPEIAALMNQKVEVRYQ